MAPAKSVPSLAWTVRCSVLAGLALFLMAAPAMADPPPSVERMLSLKPRQPGVDVSTPTKEEYAQCTVKLETSGNSSTSPRGWVLLDAKQQPVRRFYDTRGGNSTDLLCYFKDGVEVYREIDSKYKGKLDQYRWLNGGGTKWGVDLNEDGIIDSWRVISAEEVAQEVYVAVAARDYARLKALLITDAELAALKLKPSSRS
jgi:hypothetical protein